MAIKWVGGGFICCRVGPFLDVVQRRDADIILGCNGCKLCVHR